MSTTGLSQFDESLHHTNSWLKDIMEDLGWADRPAAYSALRASLHALRDRLTIEEGAHLAAQLPLMLKGVFYDGWKPANCGGKNRSVDRFLAPLEDIFGDDDTNIENAGRRCRNELRPRRMHRRRIARLIAYEQVGGFLRIASSGSRAAHSAAVFAPSSPSRTSSILIALSAITVPGGKMAVAPAA